MSYMDQPSNPTSALRPVPPTFKEKGALQREVNRLLDALAPERTTTRSDRPPVPIQQHRTPNGCILQAANAALSVSWYAEAADEGRLGELQIVLWRGVVSRRGSAQRPDGAAVVKQQVLFPIERPTDSGIWRGDDGTVYDTDALAAHCLAQLHEQMLLTPLPPEIR